MVGIIGGSCGMVEEGGARNLKLENMSRKLEKKSKETEKERRKK